MSDFDPRLTRHALGREVTADQRFWQLWRQGRRPDLSSFLAGCAQLTPTQVAAVIAIDQFERWTSGERVTAEEYLRKVPEGVDREQAAGDVIWGEYLLREQLGEQPDPEEYRTRFPEYAELFSRQLALHEALSDEMGDPPSAGRTVVGHRKLSRAQMPLPEVPGYEVLSVLGQGGMGVVYKARQLSLDRIVALKVVPIKGEAEGEVDRAVLDRKRREARITARLSHPNIVTVYDAGALESSFYLAMEYVAGVDLHHVIEDRGPMAIATACEYLRQAALGLQHAHEQGLVHRDIKPSNLMITEGEGGWGTLKILDLGLARLLPSHFPDQSALTHEGAFMGTPDFVAPEQANDPRQADIRSDLYSLGCTFYSVLTGEPPFKAATPLAKLVQHHVKDAAPIETVRPDVPKALGAIIGKLLAKRPEHRYQTPAELVQALTALASGLPKPAASASEAGGQDRSLALAASSAQTTGGLRPPLAPPRLVRLIGHTDRVKGVAFSPDGRWLASVSSDQSLRVWQVAEACEAWCVRSGASLACLAFAGDGRTVMAGSEERAVFAWDVVARRLRWRVEGERTSSLALSPGGEWVFAGGYDGTLRVQDAGSGAELRSWGAHSGAIWGLAVTPDGRRVLSGGQDRSLRLWDVHTGESLAAFPEQSMLVKCVAISPDGTRALTGGFDGVVYVWDVVRGRELGTLQGHEVRVTGVAFAPDGVRAVTASRDQTVRTWDVERGVQLEVYQGHGRGVTSVAWSPTGERIASGGMDHEVCVWRA